MNYASTVTAPVSQTRRLLCIEDNPCDAILLMQYLRPLWRSGKIAIDVAPNLHDALEQLDQQHYDLLLLDLHLSDSDGAASMAAIVSQADKTPIWILSGAQDPKLQQATMLCGAEKWFGKQDDAEQLVHAVRQFAAPAPQQLQ